MYPSCRLLRDTARIPIVGRQRHIYRRGREKGIPVTPVRLGIRINGRWYFIGSFLKLSRPVRGDNDLWRRNKWRRPLFLRESYKSEWRTRQVLWAWSLYAKVSWPKNFRERSFRERGRGALILIKKKFESRERNKKRKNKKRNGRESPLRQRCSCRFISGRESSTFFFFLSFPCSTNIYLVTDIFIVIFTLLRVRRVQYHQTGKITVFAVHLDYIWHSFAVIWRYFYWLWGQRNTFLLLSITSNTISIRAGSSRMLHPSILSISQFFFIFFPFFFCTFTGQLVPSYHLPSTTFTFIFH